MFQINDLITYGTQGVCRIVDVCEREFAKQKNTYYVLRPVYEERSTIYVPVEKEALTAKMRRVLTAEEIHKLISSMPQETAAWVDDEPLRREEYRRILASGDRVELIRVIKALYLHRQRQKENGRKLHLTDENFLKEAEKLLYDEFALVLGIDRSEVLPYIIQELEEPKSAV